MNKNVKEKENSGSTLDLFLKKLAGKYSKYIPGDIIFSEGDPGRTMLLILSGSVKITKLSKEINQQIIIATRAAGEFIGEMALVEESPRFATVYAETECEVLEFTKENFEKIIKEQPSFATRVLESLSIKLRESDSSRIVDLEKNNQELVNTNEKLSELNEFLDSVIDQSPSGILLVTKYGNIYRMNKAVNNIFGLNKDSFHNVDDIFADFNFGDCRINLKDTWSGEVKGLRIGEEFQAFLTCTLLTKYKDNVLYLLMCQDLSAMPGLDGNLSSEEKLLCAQQSAVEFADEFLTQFGILKNQVSDLIAMIPQKEMILSQSTTDNVTDTIYSLETGTKRFIESREADSDFTFVDLRITLKAIIKYCQSKKHYNNIDFKYRIDKVFPKRLYIKEIPMQNIIFNLINSISEALLDIDIERKHSLKIMLTCSGDEKYAEIKIYPENAELDPEKLRRILNEYLVFGWSYIKEIITDYNGEFLIDNNNDHPSIFVIRLPLRPVLKNA